MPPKSCYIILFAKISKFTDTIFPNLFAPMSSENDDPFPENDAPVIIPIEDSLDLHTFSPKELKAVVEEYLFQCHQKGFKEVRIIHGRGKGVQRKMVRTILEKSPLVLRFEDAPPETGGWGATWIQLRN